MGWSDDTKKALDQWLNRDTCHTWHWCDEARFYDFIASVWKEVGGLWDEAYARETMQLEARRLHPDWAIETINRLIEEAREKGTNILDFLSHARKQFIAL
jgi:hypothetical protein